MPHTALHTHPPFSVSEWFDGSPTRTLLAPLRPVADRLLALRTLNDLYRALPDDGRTLWERALDALDVRASTDEGDLLRVPRTGPLVVVANHPHGALDGLVIAALLQRVRPDVKLLANQLLARIPALRRELFFVNPFATAQATSESTAGLRGALRWVRNGGTLIVFPAGEVSHVRSSDGSMADGDWLPTVARVIAATSAAVVPVFIAGDNGRWFEIAGRIHPRLRTALLPRALLHQRGRTIAVSVGAPIAPERLSRFDDPTDLAGYLKLRTYALAPRVRPRALPSSTPHAPPALEAIAPPECQRVMASEIDRLPASQVLGQSGSSTVVIAQAAEIPHTLSEIGRLRETAFRAVGEGSGRARDLDRFDLTYRHLIVWNHERHEVVGAYRVGATDQILPRDGAEGLYTNTLFHYDAALLAQIGPALELGRAFVRPEYQRDYSPLLLLWKGIGTLVARNPRYRVLFGTVSISNEYQSLSQHILARFLHATSFTPELAKLVTPRNPPPFLRDNRPCSTVTATVVKSVADLGALVAEIESDGKGIPVLLRQYLKLNARLLGFNVDRSFGGVLDGLMMVDLMNVEPEMLVRYMGKAGAQTYRAHYAAARCA